jgi:hypothetical protein
MSPKVRFAAALVILTSLFCGGLNALPLGPRATPAEESAGVLTELVQWIVSFFSESRPDGKAPEYPQTRIGSQLDPDGNH